MKVWRPTSDSDISLFEQGRGDTVTFFLILLFNDAVNGMASKTELLMNELERIWKEAVVA